MNMTPIQFAVLLLRVFSIYLFLDLMVVASGVPADIYGIFNSPTNYITKQRELALAMALGRIVVYGGTGIAFLFFSRPLAKLFTKGIDNV
jgi:hypothetical protein